MLDQLDETIGDDFPLWDVIEKFDREQDFTEELAEHRERQGLPPKRQRRPPKRRAAAERLRRSDAANARAAAATSAGTQPQRADANRRKYRRRLGSSAASQQLAACRSGCATMPVHCSAAAAANSLNVRAVLASHCAAQFGFGTQRRVGRYIPKRRILAYILPMFDGRRSTRGRVRRLVLAFESHVVKLYYRFDRLGVRCLAVACCRCRPTSPAAEPAVLHAARVIQCERDDDARPAVVTGVRSRPTARRSPPRPTIIASSIWDAATGRARSRASTGHADWVRSVVLSPDGDDARLRRRRPRALHVGHPQRPAGCSRRRPATTRSRPFAFIPTTSRSRSSVSASSCKSSTRRPARSPGARLARAAMSRTVTFSPDGDRMAVAGRNGTIRDLERRQRLAASATSTTDGRRIRALAFSPDGTSARRGRQQPADSHLRRRDRRSRDDARRRGRRRSIRSLFLDNHGWPPAAPTTAFGFGILNSRRSTTQLVGHTGTVAALACDATGTMLVSGSYDTTLRIWNLAEPRSAGHGVARVRQMRPR